jgi:hypothetical protein
MKKYLFIAIFISIHPITSAQSYNDFVLIKTIKCPFTYNTDIKSIVLSKDDNLLAVQYNSNGLIVYMTNDWSTYQKTEKNDLGTNFLNTSCISDDNMYFLKQYSQGYYSYNDNSYVRVNILSGLGDNLTGDYRQLIKINSKYSNGINNLFTNDSSRFYLAGANGTVLVYAKNSNPNNNSEINFINKIADVDTNIPTSSLIRNNVYALIIGNEDYSSKNLSLKKEQNVPFAQNDADIFYEYTTQTLGVPKKQSFKLINATAAEIKSALNKLLVLAETEEGNAEIYFYYSGHGLPNQNTGEGYIIPVDVNGSDLNEAIKLQDIYNKLTSVSSKKIVVFLDACFSGGARDQGLLSLKSVRIKPKTDELKGNILILSSSSNDETSNVYNENNHGYFTYFLLKKIKETKGDINYFDLFNFIYKNVRKESALNNKIQTPTYQTSNETNEIWKSWLIK